NSTQTSHASFQHRIAQLELEKVMKPMVVQRPAKGLEDSLKQLKPAGRKINKILVTRGAGSGAGGDGTSEPWQPRIAEQSPPGGRDRGSYRHARESLARAAGVPAPRVGVASDIPSRHPTERQSAGCGDLQLPAADCLGRESGRRSG